MVILSKNKNSSLTDVYYGGSEEEWNNIHIVGYNGNSALTDVTINYEYIG